MSETVDRRLKPIRIFTGRLILVNKLKNPWSSFLSGGRSVLCLPPDPERATETQKTFNPRKLSTFTVSLYLSHPGVASSPLDELLSLALSGL